MVISNDDSDCKNAKTLTSKNVSQATPMGSLIAPWSPLIITTCCFEMCLILKRIVLLIINAWSYLWYYDLALKMKLCKHCWSIIFMYPTCMTMNHVCKLVYEQWVWQLFYCKKDTLSNYKYYLVRGKYFRISQWKFICVGWNMNKIQLYIQTQEYLPGIFRHVTMSFICRLMTLSDVWVDL